MNPNTPVVILCGGRGTRMGHLSDSMPKPLLRIGSYPIMWHIMKYYSHFGFKNFILALGYRGWDIKEYFLNYLRMTQDFSILELGGNQKVVLESQKETEGWNISFMDTGEKSQTGLRLSRLKQKILSYSTPHFCVTYGDGLADIDLHALLNFHESHKKIGTVTSVSPPPGRFGELIIQNNCVLEFNEKPPTQGANINGGFFVFDCKKVWDFIEEKDTPLELAPLQNMAKSRELMTYRHTGFWRAMDTPKELDDVNDLWQSRQCPWKVWE